MSSYNVGPDGKLVGADEKAQAQYAKLRVKEEAALKAYGKGGDKKDKKGRRSDG